MKIGSAFSDFHVQENGVPQGNTLSPVLFNVKINCYSRSERLSLLYLLMILLSV